MIIRRAHERGHADHGWLNSYHTFSFASYHDPQWMGFLSLRVINDDTVQPGRGFGTHPHRDMEIITYVLDGELEHKDPLDNGRVIRAGEIQYMAAGTGVEHSEFNPSPENPAHFLQIWVIPDRKNAPPRYEEKSFADATTNKWHLVGSKSGRNASIAINQEADLWLARLEAGHALKHALSEGRGAWLHVATGRVTVEEEELGAGDAVAFEDPAAIKVQASEDAQVLLFDLE